MRAKENSTSNQLNAGKRLNFASDWLRICREFPEITLDTQPKLLPLHQGIRDWLFREGEFTLILGNLLLEKQCKELDESISLPPAVQREIFEGID